MSDDGMKLRAEIDGAGHLAILSVAGGGMVALLGSYGDLISGEEVLRSVLPWTLLANLLALLLALSNYSLRRRTSLLYERVEQLECASRLEREALGSADARHGVTPSAATPSGDGEETGGTAEIDDRLKSAKRAAWRSSSVSWLIWWASIALIGAGYLAAAVALLRTG